MTIATESAIRTARASMLLDTATGDSLVRLGQNFGISYPHLSLDDELYRKLVKLLAWQPKTILFTVYKLLEILYGSQAQLLTLGLRPWRVYEVNANEIIIELPISLTLSTNEISSYMHGYSGKSLDPSTDTDIYVSGNVLTAADDITGCTCAVWVSGAYEYQAIFAAVYNPVTDVSRITLVANLSAAPTFGDPMFIEVPESEAFRGDFIATDGFSAAFTTAAGPPTATTTVQGNVAPKVRPGHIVQYQSGTSIYQRVVLTVTYDNTTNTTEIVVTVALLGGLSGIASLPMEEADGTSPVTAPHDDRVYLTGAGVLEIFNTYMDLYVRAAGIVIRVEEI